MTKALQYTLGTILIISGMIKLNDPLGFAYKLEEYYSADVLNIPFLIDFAFANGFMVSLAEIVLGMGIIVGYRIRQTLVLSMLMFIFFGFLTFYSAYFNKVTDCGCFGDAIHFTPWQSFTKDMFLLVLTIILWVKHKEIIQESYSLMLLALTSIIGSSLASYSSTNLPLIDFRPYKIGTDITRSMTIPDGAKKDIYTDIWFYKVDGEVKEFNTQEKPWDIKGAEFVNRETNLVSRGYVPPIHDFELIKDDENYTEEILAMESVLCIVSLDLNLNDKTIAKLKNIIANENNVIIISPSPKLVIEGFNKKIGVKIDIYSIDDTTCKTIIRTNPGMIRLKKGVVVDKFAL